MREEQFIISTELNASALTVYKAWLNSEKHSAFTGGIAHINNKVNTEFSAWDNYISGQITALDEGKRICHSWRTAEFEEDDQDSLLEVFFEDTEKGKCMLTLKHSQLPAGGAKKYSIGWEENYFQPMHAYFK